MHPEPTRCRALLVALPLALLLALTVRVQAQSQIDYGINQTVWKMLYGVTDAQINSAAWMNADTDGDGLSNTQELAAGTNPFNPNSNIAITSGSMGVNGMAITFPTVAGKMYSLQTTTTLGASPSWTALSPAVQVEGTGGPMMLAAPATTGSNVFYRVLVQDTDTDGDGVSDWAETITGFNPNTQNTNGSTTNDHTALLNDLAIENVVTISATKSSATQPSIGGAATDMGTITITRGGALLFSSITVPLSWGGTALPGVDYASLPSSVTIPAKVSSVSLTLVPMANPARLAGATATCTIMPGGGYEVGGTQSASVVINPAGNTNGTGLTGMYFNGTSKTIVANQYQSSLFTGTPALTRIDPTLNFSWNSGSPGAGVNATYFAVRWQGQVQPQYTETYYFDINCDDGAILWVNGQQIINTWNYTSADRIGSINLKAGVLYDIRIDYFQAAGNDSMNLYWYSNDQTKQIIPMNRLYPLSSTPAPPAITSAATAIGFLNQPFTFNVTASTSGGSAPSFALGAGSGPLPPGLSLNAATGLISGTATATGNYEVALTASNPYGVGASVLNIQILPPGSGVTRELWTGLGGPNVSDIPLTTTPGSIDTSLSTLEDTGTYADYTGERLRGYFTAPVTGNYYFWLAASNNAQLWISDDSDPVNLVERASVTAPGTGLESWNTAGQTNQQSPWLALVAGQSYYYEVDHNVGTPGSASNVSVAYLLDTTGTMTSPTGSGVVPAYLLTQYTYPAIQSSGGTIYTTNLSPLPGVTSSAAGSASLILNSNQTQAIVQFNYNGLSSPQTSYAVWGPDNNGTPTILFDLNVIDKFHPNLITPTGGYTWNIASTSAVSASTIVSDIQEGLTYLQIETVNYSSGEISGDFTLTVGSQQAPALVPDPGFTDDSATDAGAARFLNQAAFGASPSDMAAVESQGYAAWIANQMALPATHTMPSVNYYASLVDVNSFYSPVFDDAWWNTSINAPDQLRQRVAFALSEILVISDQNQQLAGASQGLGSYYDVLLDNAFGNFRTLLQAVTLHPAMGWWLNMLGNANGNLQTGYHPNENYAREVMQLFSIGLNRLWPDGTTVLNAEGNPVPTYNQNTITNGFARVFTGWTWNQALQSNGQLPTNFYPASGDYVDPMVMVKNYHELGSKTILDNVVLPPATGYTPGQSPVAGSQADTTKAAYDAYCLNDLQAGLNNIFNHRNVGPFLCRQLIQRLVESNPSPAYLYRVVQKFNDDGTAAHVRGNMAAVITAILMDGEARNPAIAKANAASGKQREPLLRIVAPARTFLTSTNSGSYSQSGSQVMTITTTGTNEYRTSDNVWLDFSSNATGSPATPPVSNPSTGTYTVLSSPAPTNNSFCVNATGMLSGTYSEPAGSTTLTVASSGGPGVGGECYLDILSGSGTSGIYTVTGAPDSNHFTVATSGTNAVAISGSVVVPKMTAYVYVTPKSGSYGGGNTLSMTTSLNGNLNVGDSVWLQTGSAFELGNAMFTIAAVKGSESYILFNSGTYTDTTSPQSNMYPLAPPPLTRSGTVAVGSSTYNLGNTNSEVAQTPLDAATVFNFYYPNYEFPGSLANSNVTTPEFQLTTASNIINLTNYVNSTILTSGNTDGLSSFQGGGVYLDLSTYMEPPYVTYSSATVTSGTKVTITTTVNVNASTLVAKLGNLLTGGALTQASQQMIIGFITNTNSFSTATSVSGTTTNPPVAPSLPTQQARDIVRAAVSAILASPEYSIQQ